MAQASPGNKQAIRQYLDPISLLSNIVNPIIPIVLAWCDQMKMCTVAYRVVLVGALHGLAVESVDESKCRIAFLVLDSVFIPHVLDPVLVPVSRVAGHEADSTITDCDAKALVSPAVDAVGRLGIKPATGRIGFIVPVDDFPALGVALGPLGEHKSGPVWHLHAITTEGIQALADVMKHANAAKVLSQVAALRPQQRLIIIVWVELHQYHLKSTTQTINLHSPLTQRCKNH